MFDLSEMPANQRDMAKKMLDGAKGIILSELTTAMSELQALEAEMSDKDFILKDPDDYIFYQYRFLDPLLHGLKQTFTEMLNEEKEGAA